MSKMSTSCEPTFACELCVRRMGLERAPRYDSFEDLRKHIAEAHGGTKVMDMPVVEPGTKEVPDRRMAQLLGFVKMRAVPGPVGEPYREVLRRARELGLLEA
jgi:hypothetical protein